MIVTPTERLRYEVTSRSDAPAYLVDLGSNIRDGVCLGACTCQGFTQSLFPAFRALPDAPVDDKFRCPHIRAARAYAFDELLDRFVAQVRKQFNDYADEER